MPEKIRCGLLGINHSHALDVLEVLQAHPDYELVGVCEPDASVRALFEGKLNGAPWLVKEALLGDASIQAVAVESDVPRLLALGQEVIAAGKHLHLDKPAGHDLAAFKSLLDSAEQKDLLVQMGYMFRYNPGFDLIRQGYVEGWFGDAYAITASMCTDLTPEKRARMAFHPGGVMLELGCHLIDIVLLLLGPPTKAAPYLRHDGNFDDGLADNTLAVLEYPHGLVTVHVAAMEPQAFPARHFKLEGPLGTALLQPLEPPAIRLALRQEAGPYKTGVHAP
ncbi:MAG: Gfo/Idh/MocA family oxidoreductase, partial [Candidatus Hydrogenedentes bacterium]|nr:Gfo/Idh/MocA family oxidoreductase [Candidatus Hydrogenedentota bacterium]